ncbi:bifunctional diguanylate cyclase/phosphodiesterase [Marinobacter sp.]|uniref:putative bifunctional diguanylate cyclase/phosphodiesterase n=1 Tax=Marinobacter sp. TaxID=50741 RepID=UPI002B2752D6|nr:bifunctional diguanylate cyclase/phosphodiesterase [Marinobacter sp.]
MVIKGLLPSWAIQRQQPELTQQLYTELRGYEYLGTSAAVLVLLVFWEKTAANHLHLFLVIWLGVMFCLYTLQWRLLREAGPELSYEATKRWAPRNRVMAFLIAGGWAALGPLLIWQLDPWQTLALALLLFSVLAMPVSAYSNDYPSALLSVLAIAVPTLTVLLIKQFSQPIASQFWLLATFGTGALLCLLSGHRLSQARRRAINEQNELIKARVNIASIERELRRERDTDPQTGLGNRRWFEHYLQQNYVAPATPFYIIALSIDRFSDVTPSFGRHAADFILQDLAGQLNHPEALRQLAARGDSDCFLILYEGMESGLEIEETVSQLFKLFKSPFCWQNQPLTFTCSLGVAGWHSHLDDSAHVIENALLSMREAAKTPGNSFRMHDSKLQENVKRQAILRRELVEVTERDELFLALQPKVILASGQVTSAEALLRWMHPELGFVSPADFIPLAESTGEIIVLGRWVINEATRLLLKQDMPSGFCMAVNVSVLQFTDPELIPTVARALKKLEGSGCTLEIEITESVFMEDSARVIKAVKELIELGAKVALDDFGTGYSSLATISQLPHHTLKLDKSFVDAITTDQKQATIVKAIIQGALLMGVDLVAEGVETKAQCELLRDFGCQLIQGYYFARPMKEDEFFSWIKNYGHEPDLESLEKRLSVSVT